MSITEEKGSAAVEMVYLLIFFLAVVALVQRFSYLAVDAHKLSMDLQNDVEKIMIDQGRPACLDKLGTKFIEAKSPRIIFGNRPIKKRLTFMTRPICQGE